MYKKDRENLNKDNQRLRKTLQDMIGQNNMLKRQVEILEQHEDVSNDQKADSIKEQLDYEIQKLRKDLLLEADKSKKWELFCNEMKQNKEKAEGEKNLILNELNKLRGYVHELSQRNSTLESEKNGIQSKLVYYEETLNKMKTAKQEIKTEIDRSDIYIENKNPIFEIHKHVDVEEKNGYEENEHGNEEKYEEKYEEEKIEEVEYQESPIEEETNEEQVYEFNDEPQEAENKNLSQTSANVSK